MHPFIHPITKQQQKTMDKQGLQEYIPRHRDTHHQRTHPLTNTHLTNTPIHTKKQKTKTQHYRQTRLGDNNYLSSHCYHL